MDRPVHAIATMDTKGAELAYIAERLRAAGVPARMVDVGVLGPPKGVPDVDRSAIAACHPDPATRGRLARFEGGRGELVAAMGEALAVYLGREHEAGRTAGAIGIGGSGGTAIITAAMRALPIGLPKLMVSTLASGNVAPYIGETDITMMYSVVDIAGLNSVSRRVLGNAAHAMAGMARFDAPATAETRAIGMTMFGLTTPCVTAVREALEGLGYDCLVFHATGSGGRCMERLVGSGLIRGVIDVTTTEIADEVVGGVLSAGPGRLDALLRSRAPLVLSLGALDMVNFGAIETVPERFRGRRLHVHDARVTLMRTNVDENRRIARWIADKLNRAEAPFRLLVPERGTSAIAVAGQPFHDPEADAALFDALESALRPAPGREIRRLPLAINDPEFARALVAAFLELDQAARNRPRGRPAGDATLFSW